MKKTIFTTAFLFISITLFGQQWFPNGIKTDTISALDTLVTIKDNVLIEGKLTISNVDWGSKLRVSGRENDSLYYIGRYIEEDFEVEGVGFSMDNDSIYEVELNAFDTKIKSHSHFIDTRETFLTAQERLKIQTDSLTLNAPNGIYWNDGDGFGYAALKNENITGDRTYQLPDQSGTFALTSDITTETPTFQDVLTENDTLTTFNTIVTTGQRFEIKGGFDDADKGVLIIDDSGDIDIFSIDDNPMGSSGLNIVPERLSISNFNGDGIALSTSLGSIGVLNTSLLTAERNYEFPDQSGTFAMVSDVPTSNVQLANGAGYVEGTQVPNHEIDPTVPFSVKSITQTEIDNWNTAEANVQVSWAETDVNSDAFIMFKPEIPFQAITVTTFPVTTKGYVPAARASGNYGDIGISAFDLSANFSASTTHGATGDRSFALGVSTTSSGRQSIASGDHTIASGENSFAGGEYTAAESFNEFVIGSNDTDYVPNGTTFFDALDRLFVVGNGITSSGQSDAFTILKNGQTAIGIDNFEANTTGELLQVAGEVSATQYKVSALNTAPASATDTGTTGEIRITATHIYVCVATDTWVRAELATW
ncbi:MAG TPA: hypothetical protein VFM82_05830 [Flavobacteriaceae bacterium]|nr:hypothetical protein [Flavobacteriaceae bacterium]